MKKATIWVCFWVLILLVAQGVRWSLPLQLEQISDDFFQISWFDESLPLEKNWMALVFDLFEESSWLISNYTSLEAKSKEQSGLLWRFFDIQTWANSQKEIPNRYPKSVEKSRDLIQQYGISWFYDKKEMLTFANQMLDIFDTNLFQVFWTWTYVTFLSNVKEYWATHPQTVSRMLWLMTIYEFLNEKDHEAWLTYLKANYRFGKNVMNSKWIILWTIIGHVLLNYSLHSIEYLITNNLLNEHDKSEIKTILTEPIDIREVVTNSYKSDFRLAKKAATMIDLKQTKENRESRQLNIIFNYFYDFNETVLLLKNNYKALIDWENEKISAIQNLGHYKCLGFINAEVFGTKSYDSPMDSILPNILCRKNMPWIITTNSLTPSIDIKSLIEATEMKRKELLWKLR